MKENVEFRSILNTLDRAEQPFVQAHINSISFPTAIEELEVFVYEHGHFNIEDILACDGSEWTVPRSCKIGDVVLWFHAKTAISRITKLITEVRGLPEPFVRTTKHNQEVSVLLDSDESEHDKYYLLEWLEHARDLYSKYGGKIFAIGRIVSPPDRLEIPADDPYHWHGRIYADVGDIVVLENPIDICEFNSFIAVSRHSAITPLPSKEFNWLRDIIGDKNDNLPAYFLNCEIGDFNLSKINRENFLTITQEYRRRFLYEQEFRSYYVDYLLRNIAGRKFYRECVCHANGKAPCFVDNVFKYEGQYFLLEVKLNIHLEQDLHGQLKKYTDSEYLLLKKGESNPIVEYERRFMYIIDTNGFYKYDRSSDTIQMLIDLDEVHSVEDISRFL